MSNILDKLDNVTVDYQHVISPELVKRFQDTVDLANSYIDIVVKTEDQLNSLNDRQTEVIGNLLSPSSAQYSYLWNPNYSRHLEFESFHKETIKQVISWVVLTINENYKLSFTVDKDALVQDFMGEGINLDKIYEELHSYLGGESFEQKKRNEVLDAIVKTANSYSRWNRHEMKETDSVLDKWSHISVSPSGKEIVWSNFAYKDPYSWNGDQLSSSAQENLKHLKEYFTVVLKEPVSYGSTIPTSYGAPWVSPDGSFVKSIKVFKNGNMKIMFNNAQGVEKFLKPIIDGISKKIADEES